MKGDVTKGPGDLFTGEDGDEDFENWESSLGSDELATLALRYVDTNDARRQQFKEFLQEYYENVVLPYLNDKS